MWLRVMLKKYFKGKHNLMVVRRMKAQEQQQMHAIDLCSSLQETGTWSIAETYASVGLAITWRNGGLICYSLLFWTFILK
jgi:nitric oxide synthase oxygenase domain/subunit